MRGAPLWTPWMNLRRTRACALTGSVTVSTGGSVPVSAETATTPHTTSPVENYFPLNGKFTSIEVLSVLAVNEEASCVNDVRAIDIRTGKNVICARGPADEREHGRRENQ
jgi:hypothetical protein